MTRSQVRSIGIAVAVLALAGVRNASAQITGSVEFTTSFPFTAGNATVPAGQYTVTADEDAPNILELSGAHTGVLFQVDPAEAKETPKKTEVVFTRYGNAYVLKNVWIEGANAGVATTTDEAERHVKRNSRSLGEQQRVDGKRKAAHTGGH